jgi:Rod binding domain-containing protein
MVNQVNQSLLVMQSVKLQSPQNMTAQQKKLMKTCTDFESMMIQKMLEVMQSSQKMFGDGFGGDYFQSMFQEEMSKKIAENGQGIGMAKMLYQQLNRPTIVK